MKLKYEFVSKNMGGRIVAIPVGEGSKEFRGTVMLDELSLEIFERLKEDTTPEEIHKYLKEKFPECTDEEIAKELVPFINKLAAEGILITP